MNHELSRLRKRRLAVIVSGFMAPAAGMVPGAVLGQEGVVEEVIVTATRRANTVQDVPINITAISSTFIEAQRITGVDELSRFVPGLANIELGPRDEFPNLVVRGLNTSDVGPIFPRSVTVASYLGDIPLQADIRTSDLERIEVLIGPQGTLYGSGTLGGAIRYLPVRPQTDFFEAEVRGRFFDVSEAADPGYESGVTLNVPIISSVLAVRASVDYLDNPGYIDYPYIVREAGVSNPQPDFSDPAAVAANLRRVEDVDFEESLAGRLAIRWTPFDRLDATLTYHHQTVETGGRTLAGVESIGTGRYEAPYRFEEPSENVNEMLSLEITADLGFAELTSATGQTRYRQFGQRDQTDLLLDFEIYYEEFPSFSAFTREIDDEDSFVQEIRLVSNGTGRLSWIGGMFYSKFEGAQESREYTPGFNQWLVDAYGLDFRPDALEYIEIADEEVTESALFGELSYAFDGWQVTFGARLYEFEASLFGGANTPQANTAFFGDPPDLIEVPLGGNETDDSGSLFKLNFSRYFGDDILGYLTISEGYRVGGVNPIAACTPEDLAGPQPICALPDEELIKPDTTTNYEIGIHSTLLSGRLLLNAAIYHIDWDDVQVGDVTLNGSFPIITNGGKADSDGIEIGANWRIGDHWQFNGTYAYNQAELASGTDAILGDSLTGPLFTPAGSRLPGSPEHQSSLGMTYSTDLSNGMGLDIGYSIAYMGNILSSIGAGEEPSVAPWRGEKIPSYSLHQFTATLSRDQWSASFFIDNVLDEYYFTSVRSSQRLLEPYRDYLSVPSNTNGFVLRSYARYIGAPRTAGLSFTYSF